MKLLDLREAKYIVSRRKPWESMTERTLCFLIKKEGSTKKVCLGMKKAGFGKGLWAGVGGKVGDKIKETIPQAAIRETVEEISVTPKEFHKTGEVTFYFTDKKEWDQRVHIFVVDAWEGNPLESKEMKPDWFDVADVPYGHMWEDAQHWLPHILLGNSLRAVFTYGSDIKITEKKVTILKRKV